MTIESEKETDWVERIGKPAADCIAEMVAALECDYERLEELREERESFAFDPDANTAPDGPGYINDREAWAGENPEDAEELAELEAAAGECQDREDAEGRIQEDALSVEVRSEWLGLSAYATDSKVPGEYLILLTTGGPAVRIRGELDGDGEPSRAWLEVQDWFKPWTEYYRPGLDETLLTYSRCFYFGQ